MATHSSVLAWRIPGTGEPGRLPSMRSHRVGHDWSNLAAYHINSSQKSQSPWKSLIQTSVFSMEWNLLSLGSILLHNNLENSLGEKTGVTVDPNRMPPSLRVIRIVTLQWLAAFFPLNKCFSCFCYGRRVNRIPVLTIMVRTRNLANKAADAENFGLDSFDEMK